MIKTLRCPVCDKFVTPYEFQLWPGVSVMVCPTCRVGIGEIPGAVMSAAKRDVKAKAKKAKP
jgi:phage FluMu protein Com